MTNVDVDLADVRFALWLNGRPWPLANGVKAEETLPSRARHVFDLPADRVSESDELRVRVANRNRLELHSLMIAVALSMGVHGVLEGAKFVVTLGSHTVIPSPTLGDNNHFALFMLMVVPLFKGGIGPGPFVVLGVALAFSVTGWSVTSVPPVSVSVMRVRRLVAVMSGLLLGRGTSPVRRPS